MVRNFESSRGGRLRPIYDPNTGDRRLRVLIDERMSVDGDPEIEQNDLLRGLLQHDLIDVWKFDGQPSPAAEMIRNGGPAEIREGWVEVAPSPPDEYTTYDVIYRNGEQVSATGVSGDLARGELARNDPTYAHLDPEEAAACRNADAVLFGVADAISADLVVTDSRFLIDGHWVKSLGPIACDRLSAIALVSQFLRLRGTYPAAANEDGGIILRFNRGLYFWVGTRAALPEGWRWFSHALSPSDGGLDDDLAHTAQSVLERIERTLRARDRLRWQLTLPQNNDVADDALEQVDQILINLVGAFDGAARVAHQAVGLTSNRYRAGWQYPSWLAQIEQGGAPDLAAMMAPETIGSDVFEVMRVLRNTVHGAGLQAIGQGGPGGKRHGTAVGLSTADTALLMGVVERRGWAAKWGLKDFTNSRVFVDPGKLVEHVVPAAIAILNDLMRETPVETFATRPAHNASPPTSDEAGDPWALRHQRSILYQLGFADFVTATEEFDAEAAALRND